MRISDWSADVCSSDLEGGGVGRLGRDPVDGADHLGLDVGLEAVHVADLGLEADRHRVLVAGSGDQQDPKSVVEGKSVEGHVDLGGHRNIEKKKTTIRVSSTTTTTPHKTLTPHR